MKLILFALVFFGCATTPKEASEWQHKNFDLPPEGMSASLQTTEGKRACTIVAMHGLGDSVEYPRRSRYHAANTVAAINETGCKYVLSLSYGPAFMLHPERDGLESVSEFETQLLAVAKKYKLPRPFYALGISMGGANLLTLAMQRPKLFEKVAVLVPMVLFPSQYKTEFNIKEAKDAALMAGKHFSEAEWAKANLFAQLDASKEMPPTLISACEQDDFGLFPATVDFGTKAIKNGHLVVLETHQCGHMDPNLGSVPGFFN